MPNAKHRTPVVPARMKVVIQTLLSQTVYDLAAAAEKGGLTVYRAREQLKKAHVLQYMKAEKQQLIETVCAGNPMALAKIRETSENAMAKVAAIRQSELMRQTANEESPGGFRRPMPGLVVFIQGRDGSVQQMIPPAQPAPMIDVTPLDEPHRPFQHEP